MGLQRWYKPREVAKALSVSYNTVLRYVATGKIPSEYVQKIHTPGGSAVLGSGGDGVCEHGQLRSPRAWR